MITQLLFLLPLHAQPAESPAAVEDDFQLNWAPVQGLSFNLAAVQGWDKAEPESCDHLMPEVNLSLADLNLAAAFSFGQGGQLHQDPAADFMGWRLVGQWTLVPALDLDFLLAQAWLNFDSDDYWTIHPDGGPLSATWDAEATAHLQIADDIQLNLALAAHGTRPVDDGYSTELVAQLSMAFTH